MNQDMNMIMNLPVNPDGNRAAAGQTQSLTNRMNQVMTIKLVSVK